MSIFSRITSKKNERILLVHIGSSSVTGAFIDITDAHPTIVATHTVDIEILSDLSLAKFEAKMEKALQSMIASIARLRHEPPAQIVVQLGSSWYDSQVRTATLSRNTPFVVTKKMLDDMVAKELKAFEDEEIAGKKGTIDALRTIESKTLQVKLNGYATENPVGISAKDLKLLLFLCVIPEKTAHTIETILTHEYARPVTFTSFLSTSFLIIRDYFPQSGEYIMVDVGGEVTDVSLVKEGVLIRSSSFPYGRNFIVRRLSAGLHRSIEESLALCNLYMEGTLEKSLQETCASVFQKAKNEWLTEFQKSLFSLTNELSIPETVLLSCHSDVADLFVDTIRREEFHQYTLTEKEFKVVVLGADLFHESLDFGESVARHPFIMMGALRFARHPIVYKK